MSNTLTINGWNLVKLDSSEERRILDVELGKRLGYADPLKVQRVIKGLIDDGELPGIVDADRTVVIAKGGAVRGTEERTVKAYYLTEREALQVIAKSRTPSAYKITNEIIDVYLVIKRHVETQSFERIRVLEQSVLELMRRIAPDPNGLLGSNARDLRARISSVAAKRRQLGDPHASLTAVDNEVRLIVDYPRIRGAKWENCPSNVATRAHSYVAAQLDTLDKRIKKSTRSGQTVIPFAKP
jgi:hypothetical protein